MERNYRRCVSCRLLASKEAFWRVVKVYPSRQVQLDRGMGRSAYICPSQSCLQAAQKKNRLGHALKTAVPPEIYQILWQRLESNQAATNSASLVETVLASSQAAHTARERADSSNK